jgi:short-subunit dehydrogenase
MNVVITGASSGIGRALALTFARSGHPVLGVARREERLRALQLEAAEAPEGVPHAAPVAFLTLDITSAGAPEAVLAEAVRVFGKVHVLVNDAAMSPYQEFRDLSAAHVRQIIDLNVRALTELCHCFLPHMLAHGERSRVVNVSSVGGYAPLPKFTVYSGSKHYVRIFTNLLRRECRGTNVRVCGLYPGGTRTEFPALAGQKPKKIAGAGMLTPERVAEIAYPAILAGRRVIIPGLMNQLAALGGKVLPFPVAGRLMEFVYDLSVEQVETTYP